jgi:hypothetical protein
MSLTTLTTIAGKVITFNPSAVVAISDHDDSSDAAHTWVFGVPGGRALIAETVDDFMKRLKIEGDFAKLTRPDGWRVWIKAAAVSSIVAVTSSESSVHTVKPIKAFVTVSGLRQAVAETVDDARKAINAVAGAQSA